MWLKCHSSKRLNIDRFSPHSFIHRTEQVFFIGLFSYQTRGMLLALICTLNNAHFSAGQLIVFSSLNKQGEQNWSRDIATLQRTIIQLHNQLIELYIRRHFSFRLNDWKFIDISSLSLSFSLCSRNEHIHARTRTHIHTYIEFNYHLASIDYLSWS